MVIFARTAFFPAPEGQPRALTFKCKGDNQSCPQQFLSARGQGGKVRTGPWLLLISNTLKMGK